MLGAIGLALWAAFDADRGGKELGLVGLVGAGVLCTALVLRMAVIVGPGLALLGIEYAAYFAVHGDAIDMRAPVYGVCFLAVAELAYGALELRAGTPEAGMTSRRVLTLAFLAVGSIFLGMVVLGAASTPLEGGLGLEAVGIAAAVGLLIGLGRLAVRR